VVVMVPAARMRRRHLKDLLRDLDPRKNLGAILLD